MQVIAKAGTNKGRPIKLYGVANGQIRQCLGV